MVTFQQLYSNIFDYPLYIGLCLLIMIIYSIIYMVLAVYIERINPGEFGVAQPWYYIFKKMCCCCSNKNMTSDVTPMGAGQNLPQVDMPVSPNNHWIDADPVVNGMHPSISTINLTKVRYILFDKHESF